MNRKFLHLKKKDPFAFQVKMGRNMSEELERMQDTDGEVRARMWATLAAQSDDAFERLTAHQRAIEAQEEVPWLQVNNLSFFLAFVSYLVHHSDDGSNCFVRFSVRLQVKTCSALPKS
jgi:hypothetical protein